MARLYACPLRLIESVAQTSRAQTLLTLLGADTPVVRPVGVAPERHLVLTLSDIVAPQPGHITPNARHMADMLNFVRAWDQKAPLLIHCWAGVSRSTASAFITLCALSPERDEADIAKALRLASPTATPNARMVAVADALLARQGRMIAAITAIGRGADCFEGAPFHLDVP